MGELCEAGDEAGACSKVGYSERQHAMAVTLLAGTLQEDCHCSDKQHALSYLVQFMFVAASPSTLHNLCSHQYNTCCTQPLGFFFAHV